MKLDSKMYDTLKWVAQLLLPALGTLYFALARIWGFPYAEEVLGTITAIDTFLGVILGLSASAYPGDGTLEIDTTDPEVDRYRINVNCDFDDISKNDHFLLKVKEIDTVNAEKQKVKISRVENSEKV